MTPIDILLTLFITLSGIALTAFAVLSRKEKHLRAARLAGLLALLTFALLIVFLLAPPTIRVIIAALVGASLLVGLVLLILPSSRAIAPSPKPAGQVDERTTIFARARLEPGTENYKTYYRDHPEHKAPDDAFRQNAGLLAPGALFYHDLLTSSPEGGFFLTESLRNAVDGPIAPQKVTRSAEAFTSLIKSLAAYHGAAASGVCELQPYHLYSHIGRGSGDYGAPIALNHTYAIALTVEMSHEMINSAPRMPAVMESARQYAESGTIAVILAAAIRRLGYPARAHIDGNYRVIAPLVAKDAGLGEIGRMGLLMTPRLGPRVRLAVVTTDLPLIADPPAWLPSLIDFCNHCQKCAAVCPSQSIPFGERVHYEDGTLRWKINPESCYTYWTKVGTDCGRCMAVCPYAHADSAFHNLIRFGVNRSGNFRRAAVHLDDFFYGKKPLPHTPPHWVEDAQNQP